MGQNLNFEDITINIEFVKLLLMSIFTYYLCLKITNSKTKYNKKNLISIMEITVISFIVMYIRYKVDYTVSIFFMVFLLSVVGSKKTKANLGYTLLSIIISLGANYILLFIGIAIDFLINMVYVIKYDFSNLIIIASVQIFLLYIITRIKRIRNGISYLNRNTNNEYLGIIILNISIIIIFSFIIIVCADGNASVSRTLASGFSIFAIMMFVTIQKSIQLYYKQKLLIQDLNETKSDLEKSKQEIETLEKQNIELSKKNHSFSHKYKALEYKLSQLTANEEIASEIGLKGNLEELSKEIYIAPQNTELSKTGISKIDDMLKFMQAECEKDKINLNLQIIGNIYYMTNHYISIQDLEILLADHIKDARIAINHSENINRSILVKIGKIEECYGVYIYDSGIEFEQETLENLGKKPITTHLDEGGSGMGFMNTFDTLRKYNASLIINQIGKPSKDNFTKILKFRFDGKNEFKF